MESNKNKIFVVIAVGVLLLLLIGSTFAYFAAQGGDASQTDVNVLTHTVDSLVFETGDALSITADQNTFAQGKGNQTDSTFARATLKANSSTNTATDHYYVYLSIDENTFEYTTTEKTAELILTINKVEGETKAPLTSIDGLNYVTVGSVSGFDITEEKNLITIANNYEITSNGTKIDEWEVILTLVNLDSNQNSNSGKVFNAQLLIQKQPVASQYIASLFTTQGANNLYHHDGTITDSEGNILDAEDGSYRYAGGDYRVSEAHKSQYSLVGDIVTLNMYCMTGAEQYFLNYENNEDIFDINNVNYYNTKKEALKKAIEDGYIEIDEVENYVCFGSETENCPYDNLYRIIGVIDNKVKLIKADYATEDQLGTDGDFFKTYDNNEFVEKFYGNNINDMLYNGKNSKFSVYSWNFVNYQQAKNETGYFDVWSYSELNKTNLNKRYLNNIGTKWSNMINETTWYVGGMNENVGYHLNSHKVYENELGELKSTKFPFESYQAKIGLIYESDYHYSSSASSWGLTTDDTVTDEYGCLSSTTRSNYFSNDNWLNLGEKEFTISKDQSVQGAVLIVADNYFSSIPVDVANYDLAVFVRPTFYLKSSVTFNGGSGTYADPYRIA